MSDHAVEILITNAIHTAFIKYPKAMAARTWTMSGLRPTKVSTSQRLSFRTCRPTDIKLRRRVEFRRSNLMRDCGKLGSRCAQTTRIHKPSAPVSFGLPALLSFYGRARDMVAWQIGDQPRQGKRQGQAAKARLTRHLFRECNGCEGNVREVKAQEIKDEPGASARHIDDIDGDAKPD